MRLFVVPLLGLALAMGCDQTSPVAPSETSPAFGRHQTEHTDSRDGEFEMPDALSRQELMEAWEQGWTVALTAIKGLTPEDLTRTVYIRGEAALVLETLTRLAMHAAYHVGQIVYLSKHFASGNWNTLSIPKRRAAATGHH